MVFIFDDDALRRIAKTEWECTLDPATGSTDGIFTGGAASAEDWIAHTQPKFGDQSFAAFFSAWQALQAQREKPVTERVPCESLYAISSAPGSSSIYGMGGWNRYFVDSTTGEILFSKGHAENDYFIEVAERNGFRSFPLQRH